MYYYNGNYLQWALPIYVPIIVVRRFIAWPQDRNRPIFEIFRRIANPPASYTSAAASRLNGTAEASSPVVAVFV